MLTLRRTELFKRLLAGNRLVTANSRLARVLSGQYGQWRLGSGDRCWTSPPVLSWGAWFETVWEQAGLQGVTGTSLAVPSMRQLQILWEQVLRGAADTGQLLRPESLANQIMETRRQAVEWRLDFDHPSWRRPGGMESNENHQAFQAWNRTFEQLCRDRGWIPPEDRSAALTRAVESGELGIDGPLDLLGFDELTPAQLELLDAIGRSDCPVERLAFLPAEGHAVSWQGPTARGEVRQMARWVRHWYEADPASSIAVVVADLGERRAEVERHLEDILLPGSPPATIGSRPWNVSLGTPLASVPLVACAFDLLELLDAPAELQRVGRVLRSPWIEGGVSERSNRALLEKRLRALYPGRIDLREVRYRATERRRYDRDGEEIPEAQRETRPWNSPVLAAQLQRLMRFASDSPASQRPSAWAEAFDRLLAQLKWPHAPETEGLVMSHAEHDGNWQAFQAWQESLRELASLDSVTDRVGRGEAVRQLLQICRDRVFQPRTPPARIQLLGLYEASGLRFDHLWVLGLHGGNWPPAARPDPFIPQMLQQEAGMPHASPQRELEVARTVTRRLLDTADDIVFSYPAQVDGEDTLPSTLLLSAGVAGFANVPAWAGHRWLEITARSGSVQYDPLERPGALTGEHARGGSTILKNQALCPFRAFAASRLRAEGLETPVDGIDPRLHGSLAHRVLELFWRETTSQKALLALGPAALDERLARHVDTVLAEERSLTFRPAMRAVEAGRLTRLVKALLEKETERSAFEVVGLEQAVSYEVAGRTIHLKIDRVDRLDTGGIAVIDYKTGKVDPRKWFGDRPEDPQLPLYAVSAESTPGAVIFTVLRHGDVGFHGVVSGPDLFPDLPPRRGSAKDLLIEAGADLPATATEWKAVLHGLMADFLAGRADVDPKQGAETCRNSYCDLQPLCRREELELLRDRGDAT